MAVNFKVIQRKNPRDLAAIPKSYAIALNNGTVDIDRLAELVGDGSTVRQNDIYAVIIGLLNVIQGELKEGRSVRLGKLGMFSISVSSDPSDTPEEVTASNIKSAKVRYRPGKELKNMYQSNMSGSIARRGGLRWNVFEALSIMLPPLAEQQAIANILTKVDEEIESYQAYLQSLQTQKKGLMQQLLTGAKRVAF